MKQYLTILCTLFFLASCDKPVTHNLQMTYTDLGNKEVRFHKSSSIDLNNDGVMDIRFHTMLVGDPVAKQDKEKYLVTSKVNCRLPVNSNENAPVLQKGELVPLENFGGYNWYEVSQIELAQKVTGMTGEPFWEGLWKSSNHDYLPVQILVNNQRFNGWVELSFDINSEKIILHKAAISKLPERFVIAGI
ncbi:MAG TPA: hypothetical protein VFU62_11505 [Hanamia sp.]|jgi:hypothetical protein|nr:hypothetical protein [Hanamia sp.]